MLGTHIVKHWSSTQATVALSSAEAELSGICRGASQGIGLRELCHDLGLEVRLRVHSDATGAIGMCRRRGLGKVRHLAVADLWIQDKVKAKDFDLVKVNGQENPADILTKPVDRGCLCKHLMRLRLEEEEGRAASAPSI